MRRKSTIVSRAIACGVTFWFSDAFLFPANTALIYHHGKLMALSEADKACKFSTHYHILCHHGELLYFSDLPLLFRPKVSTENLHYRKLALCRLQFSLPTVFFRHSAKRSLCQLEFPAVGKAGFADCQAVGKELQSAKAGHG